MQLVADRFAADDDGRVMDLATGARVSVKIGTAGGASEQLRWTVRCDMLRTLQHRSIVPLVDFGLIGETSRFEAWLCTPARQRCTRDDEETKCVRETALRFFRGVGLEAGSKPPKTVHAGHAGLLVLPGDDTGYPHGSDEPAIGEVSLATCGLRILARSAAATLSGIFQHSDGRPRVAALWGPAGSGKRTVVTELARIARSIGFVPVASRLIDTRYAELWRGRSLFVIVDSAVPRPWDALLQSALRAPRPHVFLIVGEEESNAVDSVRLEGLDADVLAGAVCPYIRDPRQQKRIRRAAERASGLPGRFARLLWGRSGDLRDEPTRLSGRDRHRAVRVAEHAAVYGGVEAVDEPLNTPSTARVWPAPGELAGLRRRLDTALAHLAAGRHAPGLRQLRQAIGGLARRDDWSDAADGALALASCLLRRGRARDAQAALEEARQYASRAGRDGLLIDIAALNGEAWIDLARLDEAENVLAAALTAARGVGDSARVANASLALARCLYWRGQYADAAAALTSAGGLSTHNTRHDLLAARIALGQGDVGRAMSLTAGALDTARSPHDAHSTAAAMYCGALVRLAIGDLDGAEREVSNALSAARLAHDPLRALRARLLRVEVERRRGRTSVAVALTRKLARIASTVPPIVRSRWVLLDALVAADGKADEAVARQIAASGLGALRLYAGDPHPGAIGTSGEDALVAEVVAIVRACQTAEDEAIVLRDLCTGLRQQLHAASVAFVSSASGQYVVVASDGARLEPGIAERAVTAGITISPHRHDDRVEGAVPVHYGGGTIGALCARWTLGSTHNLSRARVVLEMAAAAAAPIFSAVLIRRAQAVVPSGAELLGVTASMAELRQSVERAAGAPFSVLIDGESGSGKELVARAVHRLGSRRDRAFCTLNCAALPDDLVEAELFGHTRGAFTGAAGDRTGVFEDAHGGTLFLDEIGELSPRAQAKVLRVLQEGELRRVGENVARRVDVRIVAATNRDLRQDVDAGRFRLDLLYRLDVIRISVPPLRERRDDIGVLAEQFWREATGRLGSRATLSATTVAALARYDWPGNVRELQNVLAALAVRSPKRGVVPPTALPAQFAGRERSETWRLTDARRTFDERFVRAALVRTGGHRGRAAAELGVTRQGLTKLMSRLGIASGERLMTTD